MISALTASISKQGCLNGQFASLCRVKFCMCSKPLKCFSWLKTACELAVVHTGNDTGSAKYYRKAVMRVRLFNEW